VAGTLPVTDKFNQRFNYRIDQYGERNFSQKTCVVQATEMRLHPPDTVYFSMLQGYMPNEDAIKIATALLRCAVGLQAGLKPVGLNVTKLDGTVEEWPKAKGFKLTKDIVKVVGTRNAVLAEYPWHGVTISVRREEAAKIDEKKVDAAVEAIVEGIANEVVADMEPVPDPEF
jgi:hypothetical protein